MYTVLDSWRLSQSRKAEPRREGLRQKGKSLMEGPPPWRKFLLSWAWRAAWKPSTRKWLTWTVWYVCEGLRITAEPLMAFQYYGILSIKDAKSGPKLLLISSVIRKPPNLGHSLLSQCVLIMLYSGLSLLLWSQIIASTHLLFWSFTVVNAGVIRPFVCYQASSLLPGQFFFQTNCLLSGQLFVTRPVVSGQLFQSSYSSPVVHYQPKLPVYAPCWCKSSDNWSR